VCHRIVRCTSGATALQRNGRLHSALTALQYAAEVRAGARGTPDNEQYLSGATRSQRSNGRPRQNPNGWVTWLAHRTARCAHRQQPPPTVVLVVEGYKYPQPPPLQPSKHSLLLIQYKSKVQHSKTQIKATNPIKVPNSILVFRTCERITCISCCSCLLGLAFFSFSLLTLKCFVSEARDTNCVMVLAGSK
jgi:hypothetical protein